MAMKEPFLAVKFWCLIRARIRLQYLGLAIPHPCLHHVVFVIALIKLVALTL
jgi:hypothetical protein